MFEPCTDFCQKLYAMCEEDHGAFTNCLEGQSVNYAICMFPAGDAFQNHCNAINCSISESSPGRTMCSCYK